jgi:hypothetical protein
MEKGKEKFIAMEKQILLSIVECEKANIAKIQCRELHRHIIKRVYDEIINKVNSNLRFNEVEIECLVQLLTERIECIQISKDLIDLERSAYLISYERLKFTVQNFKEEKSPAAIYLSKKKTKDREEIRKTKTAIIGDEEKYRLMELNQQ